MFSDPEEGEDNRNDTKAETETSKTDQKDKNSKDKNSKKQTKETSSDSNEKGGSAAATSVERRKDLIGKMTGASRKLKAAGLVAQASSNWPGQPTSRACTIL